MPCLTFLSLTRWRSGYVLGLTPPLYDELDCFRKSWEKAPIKKLLEVKDLLLNNIRTAGNNARSAGNGKEAYIRTERKKLRFINKEITDRTNAIAQFTDAKPTSQKEY